MENLVRGPFRRGLSWTLIGLHAAAIMGFCMYLPWRVERGVLMAAFVYFWIRGLSITVMYHRYFTHGAFRCHWLVKYIGALCGCLPFQGPAKDWCENHHQHHAFTEKEWDPHSPWAYIPTDRTPTWREVLRGFWWAQVEWLYRETNRPVGYKPRNRSEDERVVAVQDVLYWPIGVGVGFLLPLYIWGVPGLVWCGFIGVVGFFHVTWFINSVCHLWGDRPIDLDGSLYTKDQSRNNLLVALFTFGEGWHGNHHVKPNAANLGRNRWNWDPGFMVIRILERLGLAWDVVRFP